MEVRLRVVVGLRFGVACPLAFAVAVSLAAFGWVFQEWNPSPCRDAGDGLERPDLLLIDQEGGYRDWVSRSVRPAYRSAKGPFAAGWNTTSQPRR